MSISARRACWVLALALFCGVAGPGCHLFPLVPRTNEGDRPDGAAPPLAGAPGKHQFRVAQFIFLSDFEIKRDLPLFKELGQLREQVYRELRLPPSNTEVFVYLFQDRDDYERFMAKQHPDLPKRRAFFIAQPRRLGGAEDLLVYTYWGDRIQQDLRHELTHALLHCALKDVPLWLDEGLAEYFEVPPTWNTVNATHVETLLQGTDSFSLERLERLKDVNQMTPTEYREAWAWVHLMLRSTPPAKQVLLGYLRELRTTPTPAPLRPRLATAFRSPEQALRTHLAELNSAAKRRAAANKR